MFIRYRHARNTFVGVTAAGLIGGVGYVASKDAPPPSAESLVASSGQTPSSGRRAKAPTEDEKREMEARLRKVMFSKAKPHQKLKDALGSDAPAKLNLYETTGDTQWDRMKVDENRDGTWDAKWTFKGGHWVRDGAPSKGASKAAKAHRRRGPGDLRAARARVLGAAKSRAEAHSKRKDALGSGAPMKVNLYEDTGDRRWDRAKIDFDRDGAWDEKWSFKDGRWEANGQPVTALIQGTAQAAPKIEAPAKGDASQGDLPPDKLARLLLSERATSKKRKDATGGRGAKVNLYDDDQDGHWDRAKVDANRDGKWDEKWTVKGGVLERKQEVNGKVFVWKDGTWVEKK